MLNKPGEKSDGLIPDLRLMRIVLAAGGGAPAVKESGSRPRGRAQGNFPSVLERRSAVPRTAEPSRN
jgi:hypothetical protein